MTNFLKFRVFTRYFCTQQNFETVSNAYKNPCLDLQQYLDIPIFKKYETCFNPSIQSMKFAQRIFAPSINKEVKCVASAIHLNDFPSHDLPEVAFLGRSNAGKSSLLKAILCEIPELHIKTSKKPGSTKALKFYQVGNSMCLVDMPGYGFRQPKWFETSVIPYLKKRTNLVKAFFLVDGKEGFHSWDDAALQMLEDLKIPFAIILTKIDQITDSQRLKNLLHLQNIRDSMKTNFCFPQLFMLSAQTFEGMLYFLAFLAHITGNLNIDSNKNHFQ